MKGQKDSEPVRDSKDDEDLRKLIKRSLTEVDQNRANAPKIAEGVFQKIQKRSKGRFFGARWATQQAAFSVGFVAVAMLLLAALTYFLSATAFFR